jgi:anhydro-N-acetylmuramic acid kinase
MITKLAAAAAKPVRIIIGLMSGTSLDGLDVALCRITGSGSTTSAKIIQFETIEYVEEFRTDIRSVFSKRMIDLENLCLLNASIGLLHADIVNQCLLKWNVRPEDVDCIASHGQTIYHAPQRLHAQQNYPNATLQIGDADHIAVKTGIITLSDFRQKHIAAGGEGAPLALYGDYLMFTSNIEDRILLNIGGIANFTFLPRNGDTARIISTDVGPGNTLIDQVSQKYFNVPFDKDAQIAKTGTVNEALLGKLLEHSFFKEAMPKTTGPELFNLQLIENALGDIGGQISNEDLLATVTRFTAESIALPLKLNYNQLAPAVYLSGGGAHNQLVIAHLSEILPSFQFKKMEDLGISGDAKEAVLFAVLANETICGSIVKIGNSPAVTMGKISLPH